MFLGRSLLSWIDGDRLILDLARPSFLWLLVTLVPLLIAWGVRGRRRQAAEWRALGQGGRLRGFGPAGWLAAIVCLVVALAGPRWGRVPSPPLPPGRDVVLLMDTSRSMGAEDAVPNRLGVAVETAESLVRALGREPGNRMAVVAFAGRGVVRCPLTENLGAVAETLRTLRPGDVRPGGTDLGAALLAARDVFGSQEHAGGRTIIVFSDGEDHAGRWQEARDRLRAAGVVVHAVAVGDSGRGHPVPSGHGGELLWYQGAPVLSRRSDRTLSAVSEAYGGAVVPVGLTNADLGDLFLHRIEPVARQKRLAFRPTERAERFSWPVLAALGAGLLGSWPGRGWRWRWRWRRQGPGRLARWAGVLVVLGLGAGAGTGGEEVSLSGWIEAGRSAYSDGRWSEALAAFNHALALDPSGPVPHYDAAATLFQLHRYAEAHDHYRAARERAGAGLRTKIDYALGNTSLALGDVAGAIRHYAACRASTASGPDLDGVRRDAAINQRFAEEAARRSPSPPSPDEGSNSAPRPRSPGPNGQGETAPDPNASGAAAPEAGEGVEGQEGTGRRGAGGAGGSGSAPPEAGTPDERLDAALERVREARRQRLPEPPPPPANGDRKDW